MICHHVMVQKAASRLFQKRFSSPFFSWYHAITIMTNIPTSPSKTSIVLGLVLKENQVLLVRSWKKPTLWQLPGGWIEENESEIQAITREVYEETGITCKAHQCLGTRNHPLHRKEISYWLCSFENGQITIQDTKEIAEAIFVPKDQALQLLGETLFSAIRHYLQTHQ